jgi:hypothetical protein
MKTNWIAVLCILVLILWSASCTDPGKGPTIPSSTITSDTLIATVADGIILRLDGLKDVYHPNDTLAGTLRLINFGSVQPLALFTSYRPPHAWSVSRIGNQNLEYFSPLILYAAEWRDTLRVGDTLSFRVEWPLAGFYPPGQAYYELRAFSGAYELVATLGGNPLVGIHPLTKFLTVADEGEPLDCVVANVSPADSLHLDLVIRNCRLAAAQVEIDDPLPITMNFVYRGDTLLALRYAMPDSILSLPPRSDNVVFRFRRAKAESVFNSIRGRGVDLWTVCRLRDRVLTPPKNFIFIP